MMTTEQRDAADAAAWDRTLVRAVQNTMPPRVCRGQEATFAARDTELRALASEISLSPPSGCGALGGPRPT